MSELAAAVAQVQHAGYALRVARGSLDRSVATTVPISGGRPVEVLVDAKGRYLTEPEGRGSIAGSAADGDVG